MPGETAFEQLRNLLQPYATAMIVKADTPDNFYLEEDRSGAKPQLFGAVQRKKSYTALHLFPVYTHPGLLDDLSPVLRKRMQGKSCFNFKPNDTIPVEELSDLIARCDAAVSRS